MADWDTGRGRRDGHIAYGAGPSPLPCSAASGAPPIVLRSTHPGARPMSTELLVAETQLTTSLTVPSPVTSGDQIAYRFDTLGGNQPNAYANYVFLWQTAQQSVPTSTPPEDQQEVSQNQPNGTGVFSNLNVSLESYLLAYAVGPSVQNVVSTVLLPAGTGEAVSFSPSVSVNSLGSSSFTIKYRM